MSNKRTDRPNAGNGDDNKLHIQSSKSARLDRGHASASAAAAGSPVAAHAAASSPSALPTNALSPAQRLYSDALISVFGFLDLRGLIRAHASCRSWRDAARKEPSRKIVLSCEPSQLAWFCASPLRHHVSEYSPTHPTYFTCTVRQFAALRAFPALTRVKIRVDHSSLTTLAALRGQDGYAEVIAATVAKWPSRLTHLNIGLANGRHDDTVAARQVLIDCIGRLGSLSELELQLPELRGSSLTLQPLLQLTQLQSLKLVSGPPVDAEGCLVLKQMSSLTHLDLEQSGVSAEALKTLCSPPHQLAALQWIELLDTATAAHVEALLTLPALSTLHIRVREPAAIASIPRFPHLRSLQLGSLAATSAFMPHLTRCTQLTALHIRFSHFTLADLAELTRTLTALTSLEFHLVSFEGLDRPDSLASLHSLPQLRELNFDLCAGVRLAHLTDPAFTSLSSLRSLSVSLQLPERDVAAARSLFAVPGKLMPQLTRVRIIADS